MSSTPTSQPSPLSEVDNRLLDAMIRLLEEEADAEQARSVLAAFEWESKLGSVCALEMDVEGYYGLGSTKWHTRVLEEAHAGKTRAALREHILGRLRTLRAGNFEPLEQLYHNMITHIEFEGRTLRVREVQRDHWDYILFEAEREAQDEPLRHYVEFLCGGAFLFTMIRAVSAEDSLAISAASPGDIKHLLQKYRCC